MISCTPELHFPSRTLPVSRSRQETCAEPELARRAQGNRRKGLRGQSEGTEASGPPSQKVGERLFRLRRRASLNLPVVSICGQGGELRPTPSTIQEQALAVRPWPAKT